ncbi:MAG: hypothetical protein ACXVCY_17615 [Pseudobdellovibrionaceae bacterium]
MRSMFWGVFIILVGLSVLLGAIFGINIPVFKILFGLFLVYVGIKIILGTFSWDFSMKAEKRSSDHEAVFANAQFAYPNAKSAKEYVTVFGNSRLDLTSITADQNIELESVTVFGESEILAKKGTPLRIESNTIFAKSELPGKNVSAFGQFNYSTPGLKDNEHALTLKATAVFGNLKIIEQ